MKAICYAKCKKWREALDVYDDLLPLISKTEGQGGKAYNSALIQKSALLVTLGNHRLASTTVNKYLQLSELSDEMVGELIVDDMDHVLALDTAAATHLKLGNVDKAQTIFEKKLSFVKALPNNDEMKSDTMHKLGCLLAYKKEHKEAIPLLSEALDTRKFLYDGKSPSVFESTWAVAAASQTIGDTNRALKEYAILLEKMNQNKMNDSPVDLVLIHNSADKLFFDEGKIDKSVHSFRQALAGSDTHHNPQLKAEVTLNLANALSARGEHDKAMDLYDTLLSTKSLKRTKMFFLTLYNKSLLLIKMGEVEEARDILDKVAATRSSMADDVRGSIYLALGNLSISEGNFKEALSHFDNALDAVEDGDIISLAHVKRNIGNAYFESGQSDKAIAEFDDVLEDLSDPTMEGSKAVELLRAEVWNCLSRVYRKKGDLSHATHYAKLALQTYKSELGDKNPITLRNVSNLQLLLLEDAESMEKADAKPIIDAAKYEMENALETFVALDDPWTYRLDVASLKTNLGFVAVWQGKPKKARKMVRQLNEIEIPDGHPLAQRIEILEQRVEELEKKKGR